MQPPQTDEYGQPYAGYVGRVPKNSDIFSLLIRQPEELKALLAGISDEQANVRPAPAQWSIKEVVGHICDAERILSYRALRVARGDTTPIEGFEQDDYVNATDFSVRSLSDLLEEFAAHRHANVLCFTHLTEEETLRRGTASNYPVSVRALIYMLVGHVLYHVEDFRKDYHIGAPT